MKMKSCLVLFLFLSCIAIHAQTAGNPPQLTAAQWQEDVRFLADQMPKQHPNLYRRTPKEKFDAAFRQLIDAIPTMSQDEIYVGLMKIFALAQDGHTSFIPPPARQGEVFPIRLYLYEDGLFIRKAPPAYASLVGGKIVKFSDLSADEAIKRILELVPADNEMGRRENAPLLMVVPAILAGAKINADKKQLKITVEKEGKQQTTVIAPGFSLMDLVNPPADWADLGPKGKADLPYYLRDPRNNYWYIYDKENKLVYVQQNAVMNKTDESVAQFYKRVMDFVAANPVEKFVLDLRNNDGGNNGLNRPVVIGLIKSKIDVRGHLFVITGRATFSAAQNFVNELEKYTTAIFVGEPTAGHPNHYGDARPIQLPNSKLQARVSTIYWRDVDPRDERPWTAPEVAAPLTSADYKNGIDPALKAILEYKVGAGIQEFAAETAAGGSVADFSKKYDAFRANPINKYADVESAVNTLGYTLLRSKRVDDAIAIFQLNVRDHPNSANVHDSLGDALDAAGRKEDAIKSYEKALSIDPAWPSSLESLRRLRQK